MPVAPNANTRPSAIVGVERGPSPPIEVVKCTGSACSQSCPPVSTSRHVTISLSPRCSIVTARLPTIAKPDHPAPIGWRHKICGGFFSQSRASGTPSSMMPVRCGPRYCGKSGRPLWSSAAFGAARGGAATALRFQRGSKIGMKSPVTPRTRKAAASDPASTTATAKIASRNRHGARESPSHQIASSSTASKPTAWMMMFRIWN